MLATLRNKAGDVVAQLEVPEGASKYDILNQYYQSQIPAAPVAARAIPPAPDVN